MPPTSSILVCHDDPAVAELLALTFRLDGHEVEVCSRRPQISRRLEGEPPSLVIIGVPLAEVDPLSLLEGIRSTHGWEDCPVMMITAEPSETQLWQWWSQGANYVLNTPVNLGHILEAATHLIEGRSTSVVGDSAPYCLPTT